MEQAVADVDFTKVKQLGNRLLDQLADMRTQSPILWSERQQAWIVNGHAEVVEGFRGQLPLSANRFGRIFSMIPQEEAMRRIPYTLEVAPRFLISLDPPEQQRLRKLMLRAFSRRVAENYRPFAQAAIAATLDSLSGEVEFVEQVARQVPARLILKLMGLDEAHLPRLRKWAWALVSGLAGGGTTFEMLDACEAAMLEMRELFLREIDDRRRAPGDDFISALVTAEEDGDRLSEEDILATCYLTLIAGHDTTANTIALGTAALAKDRDAWMTFRDESQDLSGPVMELMRYVAMSTSMARIVTEDFDWNGNKLRQGDLVWLMIAGANRDPAVFDDPDSLRLSRPQNHSMVFAPGLHFCIGHFLAKMQVEEFFRALVTRFDRVELLDDELDWGTSLSFRGLQSLNARLVPRGE
ncbi:MAG: hypothetical protein JWN69_2319 [Alphaproteobacteria bacterium]|nr:hypothetical protein [Alphaproteobacteria bacterium]